MSWVLMIAISCISSTPDGPLIRAAQAQSGAVKVIFEKYNLLGTFALDCSKPASEDNWYFIHRAIDDNHVQRDMMIGPTTRRFVFLFDRASALGPNEIAVGGTRDGEPIESTYRVEQNRQLETEATLRGNKVIAGGKFVSNGRDVPWANKCGA
jgi:hypothetical protein